jgi:hypothetical protein
MAETDLEGKAWFCARASRLRERLYKAGMRMFVRLLLMGLLGIALGVGSALWFGGMIAGGPRIGDAIEIDGWRSDWSIGSENANQYIRARVARNGLMGLRKEEAVYFMKTEDDDGAALNEACTYLISGSGFPASWWSITLYDGENRLPMNEDDRLSFDQTQAEAVFENASRTWEAQVSAKPPAQSDMPWISSRAGGTFDLTLRLYQPEDSLLEDPEAVLHPPGIARQSCDEEGH